MSLVFTLHKSIAPTTLPRLLNLSASTTFRSTRSFSHPQISTMSLPSPVPIALCGKSQTMATNFSDSMSKEGYEGLSYISNSSSNQTIKHQYQKPPIVGHSDLIPQSSRPHLPRPGLSKIHPPLPSDLLHRAPRRRNRKRLLRIRNARHHQALPIRSRWCKDCLVVAR